MKLIANKPCSFGGMQFYIGDEIPINLVADAGVQAKMNVLTIINDDQGVSDRQSDILFTQAQVDKMLAEAIDEAVNNTIVEMEQKQKELHEGLQNAAKLKEIEPDACMETVQIAVKCESDGENAQCIMLLVKVEELQQVFSIMQLNADEGVKAIADVKSENVLILLHAADSRKTIKDAAKKQAGKLFSVGGVENESSSGNETTGVNMEGADT